jgi:predicted nucleic acid-binding protein
MELLPVGLSSRKQLNLSGKILEYREKIREHRQFLLEETKVVTPLSVPPSACRDPQDLMILGTAWAEKADIIIMEIKICWN